MSVIIAALIRFFTGVFTPGWDESVYLGMAKYYASFGNVSFVEALRPPIIPIVFGMFWLLGIQMFLARIVEIAAFVGSIVFGYLYAEKVFNKTVATLFAILLSLSPLLFHFSGRLLTEIPALFFLMLGLFLFSRQRWFWCGVMFSLAFLTKFPLGIMLVALLIGLVWEFKNKEYYWSFIGFSIPAILYLVANTFMFSNAFEPFTVGKFVIEQTGLGLYTQPWWFYFVELVKENVIIIFTIIGGVLLFKERKKEQVFLFITAFLFLGYFTSLAHKEVRFMILFFPLFLLLGCYGVWNVYDRYPNKRYIAMRLTILAAIIVYQVVMGFMSYSWYEIPTDQLLIDEYYADMRTTPDSNIIWVSNPLIGAYSDKKPLLMYYPAFTGERVDEVLQLWNSTEHFRVYFSLCDIPCGDKENDCIERQTKIVGAINALREVKTFTAHNCEWIIAEK